MLSTSHEAFYALDSLRHKCNIRVSQLTELMDFSDITYRAIARELYSSDSQAGLQGAIDLKVRRGIALMIFGINSNILPLREPGLSADDKAAQTDALIELVTKYNENRSYMNEVSSDPTGYALARTEGTTGAISIKQLVKHAVRYASWSYQ